MARAPIASRLTRLNLTRLKSLELGGLALVIAVAAYTRLSYLNLVMFQDDEAAVAGPAIALVTGHGIPLIGAPASMGFNNPPIFVYFMAIPYAFTRDPELATGFIGLLGVFAVAGCYRLTRAYFGVTAAMVASLLFAAHPWAIIYARKIWEPEALPLLAVLFIASLLAYLSQGRGWQLVATCLWLALAVGVHLSGVVLLLVFVLALAAHRDRFRWPHLLAGAIVAFATTVPYLLWQIQHDWTDVRVATGSIGGPSRLDLTMAWYVLSMVGSPGYVLSDGSAPFAFVYQIEGGLMLAGLIYILYLLVIRHRAQPTDRRRALGILLLWVLAPVFLLTRHSTDLYRHYAVVVFPAQFIAIGILIAGVLRAVFGRAVAGRSPLSLRALSALRTIVAFSVAMGFVVPQLSDYIAYHDLQWHPPTAPRMAIADPYEGGTPVGYQLAVARELASLSSPHPEQPIYLQAPAFENLMALRLLAGRPLTVKPLGARTWILVFPPVETADALFVTTNVDGPATELLRSVDSGSPVSTMSYPASDLRVAFYRVTSGTRTSVFRALDLKPLPYALDNGVRFIGYSLPRLAPAGGSVTLVVAWEVESRIEISPSGYQFFAHLVDATSRPEGGIDALDYGAALWSPGDTVIAWYELKVDPNALPGLYHVLIGMYGRQDTRLVPVVGEGGPTKDVLSLGPLKVMSGPAVPTARDAVVQHRQDAQLSDQVTFLGYDLSQNVARPGDTLTLTLHWVAGAPRPDYTVFVHLVDQTGRLVAQVDSQPRGGAYPTSAWDQGEYVRDQYRLELPPDLPPGTYRLVTGMYQLNTGRRLPVVTGKRRPGGDSIELDSPIEVR